MKASPSPKAARPPKWIGHFGLRESPFSKDLEDDALWMPTSRLAIVADLVDALIGRAPRMGGAR